MLKTLFSLPFRLVDKYWFHLTLLLFIVIVFLSLKPNQLPPSHSHMDKVYHCIAYASLVIPMALKRPSLWLHGVGLMFLLSGVIELVQPITGRTADWLDFLVNGIGLIIGVSISMAINQLRLWCKSLFI